MNATTVAIDLAKDVFELAFADDHAHITERKRLRRDAFAQAFDNRAPLKVVMEACSSAHYWARRFSRTGHTVSLLPARDVRPYVRRNKTDRADAAGLLEAARCGDIHPVPIKTIDQQAVQSLHRVREHFKVQRVASMNLLRGVLREFGITIPLGAAKVRPAVLAALADAENDLAMDLRHTLAAVLAQIEQLEDEITAIEKRLAAFARRDLRSQRLLLVPGIGLITATAISASVGELERFKSGRHFASWLGLTPKEHSSGKHRRLGRVTKRGDIYLRTMMIHGARSMLQAARGAKAKGKALDPLRSWAADLAERVGHNKAAVAVANKLARRLWAAEHHRTAFNPDHESFPNCPITV